MSTGLPAQRSSMRSEQRPPALRWREGIPVIHGGDHVIYVGDHRLRIDLSADDFPRLLALATLESDLETTSPASSPHTPALVDYLRAIGALAPQSECWWLPPSERAAIQPHVLALSEWHRDPQEAIAARTTWRIGVLGVGAVTNAIGHLLDESGLTSCDPTDADLVVLVGSHGINAPEALLPADERESLSIRDRPHLPVSTYRAQASIGPLVVPGRTPCLHCLHLHRCDRDPSWPQLVHQWQAAQSQLTIDTDPLVAWQAASSAVSMVRHWVDSAQATEPHRIRWRFPEPIPTRETSLPHPSCGCRWAGQPD